MTMLLYVLFFVSGISALMFETLWFHQAGLAFGNSVWASSLVLSGFMGGLALGNTLAARYGDRLKNPVRVYTLAEVTIASTGVGLVYLLPILGAILAPWLSPFLDHQWILNLFRFLIAFSLLVIPSTAMGVTLPVLTKVLTRTDRNFGRVLGRLYGWNTLGAVMGTVVAELYLIRILGIHGTAFVAGTLNLVAALVAAWLSTQTEWQALEPTSPSRRMLPASRDLLWPTAAFLSGFCLLALEVIWFRFLLLFVIGHSSAFALMLAIVLAGIALGGLAASYWLHRWPDAHPFVSPVAFWTGAVCVVSYADFSLFIEPYKTSLISVPLDILHVGVPLMLPISFLSGIFFTLVGAVLRNNLPSEAGTTGVLTLANTAGAALGSLLGGFVLLPVFGMERSFFLIALLYGAIGVLLMIRSSPLRLTYASAAVFLASVIFFPFGSMEHKFLDVPPKRYAEMLGIPFRVAAIREGLAETVSYIEDLMLGRPISYVMLTNGYSMSATSSQARRYMKLYVYLPMAIDPDLKKALLICYGVGNTAKALTDSKNLETIEVVDISKEILDMTSIVYPNNAENPLRDHRVHTHIEDGRYFLQTTYQRFDLITAEPPPPGISGVENLYTREYFQLLYDHLAEGGIVTYWLPLGNLTNVSTKAILRAFCDVFEDCSLWNGRGPDLMMVGSRKAQGPVAEDQFSRQWSDPIVGPEMRRLGFELPEELGALFIGDAAYLNGLLSNATPLVDNDPELIEAPVGSHQEAEQIFRSFTDESAAKERFRTSPLIKHLWPERLLTASLPYFEVQDMINTHFYDDRLLVRQSSLIEDVNRLLTKTSLSTPILWSLGSDSDIQQIVATEAPDEQERPPMQFQLGIRLLAERQYSDAAESFSRAEQDPQLQEDAFRLQIYALCLSGRIKQAQQLVQQRFSHGLTDQDRTAMSMNNGFRDPFWGWMQQTFGIVIAQLGNPSTQGSPGGRATPDTAGHHSQPRAS